VCGYPVFPTPFMEETVDCKSMDYFWALYYVSLIFMSVFMPRPWYFIAVYLLGSSMPPVLFFLNIDLAIWIFCVTYKL
jgi:disulfide bond formation protein DsbB